MTMSSYRVEYLTSLLLTVWVKADSEEDARSDAWDMANDYVTTVVGDGANVRADARVEAIGATSVIKQRGNE